MKLTEDQARTLAAGDQLEIGDGAVLRLVQEPDDFTTINDFDCYGRCEWSRNTYRGAVRPDGFDGCAEMIGAEHYSTLWWQPPTTTKEDRRQWHTDLEYRRALRQLVRDITNYGFSYFRLEYCVGADAFGALIVRDFVTVGGVEPCVRADDMVEFVLDLAADLDVAVTA